MSSTTVTDTTTTSRRSTDMGNTVFPYKTGDRLKLTREIVVVNPVPDARGRITAKIPETGEAAYVPLAGATFESIGKTLREQYEALPVGARFKFVPRGKTTSGEADPLRIKLSDNKYYQPGLDILHSGDGYWIMDDDSFDIKEV